MAHRFERWLKFHRTNPEIWRLFAKYTLQLRARNRKGSARAIGERIRWEKATELVSNRTDPEALLNDHYWPYYARLAAAHLPGCASFFDFRKLLDVGTDVIAATEPGPPDFANPSNPGNRCYLELVLMDDTEPAPPPAPAPKPTRKNRKQGG